MIKALCALLLTGLSAVGHAEADYQVMMLDTTSDTKALQKFFPKAEIHNLADSEKLLRAEPLTLHDQAVFFEKTGLVAYVKNLDQLDRDQLVRWMRHYNAAQVHVRYKDIPKEVCAKAIQVLHTF